MSGYFNRHHEETVDIKVFDRSTVSTLLVPKELTTKMNRVIPELVHPKNGKSFWDFRSGLRRLVSKYRGFLACGNIPFQSKPKLTFQEDGQDLQKFSFRVDDDVWFELGILAYGCGVSRCWLFSYLLSLELSGVSMLVSLPEFQKGVTTATLSRPRLILQIFGKRRYIHRKIHFRI
jgi:hypothetical protein